MKSNSEIQQVIKPILSSVNDLSEDIIQIIKNNESDEYFPMIQEKVKATNNLIEKNCFNIVKYTMNYLFYNDESMILKFKLGESEQRLLIHLEKLREYFGSNKDQSLQSLLNKLKVANDQKFGEIAYLMEDSEPEGIYDDNTEQSDIEDEEKQIKIQLKPDPNKLLEENQIEAIKLPLKITIEQLKNQISELQQENDNKQNILYLATKEYLKDIQHYKEMLNRERKEYNIGKENYFEVEFLDITQILDEQIRELVNYKIANLREQFNQKVKILYKEIAALRAQIELKDLPEQYTNMTNLQKLYKIVQELLKTNDNPYQIYQTFIQQKGIGFFIDIFLNQKHDYGINYKEINKLLMSKKIYDREYQEYKQTLEDNYLEFFRNVKAQQLEASQELVDKKKEIEQLKLEYSTEIESTKSSMVEEVTLLIKYMLSNFTELSQFEKLQKQIRSINGVHHEYTYLKVAFKNIEQRNQIKQLLKNEQKHKIEFLELQKQNQQLVLQKVECQNKYNFIHKSMKQIFDKLSLKIKDENFQEIDLEVESQFSLSLMYKLNLISGQYQRFINENMKDLDKQLIIYDEITVKPPTRNVESLTKLYDINIRICDLHEDFDYEAWYAARNQRKPEGPKQIIEQFEKITQTNFIQEMIVQDMDEQTKNLLQKFQNLQRELQDKNDELYNMTTQYDYLNVKYKEIEQQNSDFTQQYQKLKQKYDQQEILVNEQKKEIIKLKKLLNELQIELNYYKNKEQPIEVKKKVHKRTIKVEEVLPKEEDYKMPTYKEQKQYQIPKFKRFIPKSPSNTEVFERLYNDFGEREERLDGLQQQLQRLDELHWEEILSFLNLHHKIGKNKNNQESEDFDKQESYDDFLATLSFKNGQPFIYPTDINEIKQEHNTKEAYFQKRYKELFGQKQSKKEVQEIFELIKKNNQERREFYQQTIFQSFRNHNQRIQAKKKDIDVYIDQIFKSPKIQQQVLNQDQEYKQTLLQQTDKADQLPQIHMQFDDSIIQSTQKQHKSVNAQRQLNSVELSLDHSFQQISNRNEKKQMFQTENRRKDFTLPSFNVKNQEVFMHDAFIGSIHKKRKRLKHDFQSARKTMMQQINTDI